MSRKCHSRCNSPTVTAWRRTRPFQISCVTVSALNTLEVRTMPRLRNYSFAQKNPDNFDEVDWEGKTFVIPARIGSCYWAILRVAYESPERPIYFNELAERVEALMTDRDASKWAAFQGKPDSLPWQERIVLSARLLTRIGGNNPYGLRTAEQGMVLSVGRDGQGRPYLILRSR